MTIDEAIDYFGTINRVRVVLGLAASNTTRWKRKGYIPYLQQFRLAMLTNGELMPDDIDPEKVYAESLSK